MSYIIERGKLKLLFSQGAGVRAIGRALGRSAGAVSRELKRNGTIQTYKAQEAYASRRERSKPQGKWNPELASEIEADLEKTYSPEQIQHSRKRQDLPTVAFKTLYNWLYTGRLSRGNLQVLRHKGKRQKPPRETRTLRSASRSGSVPKPFAAGKRSVIGSWTRSFPVEEKAKRA